MGWRRGETPLRWPTSKPDGLIATITTGVLGMNLLDATHASFADRLALFALVAVPSALLTGFAIAKSKALSDFLEALSDERLSPRAKFATLTAVWRRPRPPDGG